MPKNLEKFSRSAIFSDLKKLNKLTNKQQNEQQLLKVERVQRSCVFFLSHSFSTYLYSDERVSMKQTQTFKNIHVDVFECPKHSNWNKLSFKVLSLFQTGVLKDFHSSGPHIGT